MKLSDLAEKIDGKLSGNGDIEITGANSLEAAKEGEISYLALHSYREKALNTNASAVIVHAELPNLKASQIIMDDPYLGFAKTMRLLYPLLKPNGKVSDKAEINNAEIGANTQVDAFSYIGENSIIGKNCHIHPHVYIGSNVTIGDNCIIHSHVSIREDTVIGNRVILQNGCRIGSDGYGFAKENGKHLKIPQIGNVVIGDDVEIGANCCIDRSTLTSTIIGSGTKLDNLVQIGHNVTVGKDSLLVAQVGIAGSTTIGNKVTLAGQVGVSGHLKIGDGVTVGGKSGITKDVPPETVYTGYPAIPYSSWTRLQHLLAKMLEDARNNK